MPGDIQWQVFAYIVSEVETPLIAATTQVFNAFISYVQTPLKLALILYVALTGILFIRGEASEPGSVVMSRGIKFAIIVWLLTGSGLYQQWVYNFFFVSLPNGLSQSLTSTGAAGAVSANSFDDGWIKSWRAGLEVWNRTAWDDFAQQIGVLLFWIAAVLSNVFCFAIWLISRIILAVYIALGPLLIPLVLFPATRGVFERWIGALISCVILQITTIVLLYIILLAENQVLAKVVTTSRGGDSIQGLQVLLSGIVFFAVAAFVAVQLPGVASSLSGGLSFHTGAVVRGMQKAMGGTGSTSTDAAGNTTRSGRSGIIGGAHYGASLAGRGIAAGARGIRQAIRPTTGGSLSDRGGA
ncbi:Channel protein VirB6 (plasmid) [Roseomonas mucosa]|uniref:type IV secretion system protein n=1 Tax=Roseomonas mucosa TaxID=207340 RepID=UPI0022477512|nr:type IV secretion system protein [Roseomonas mucosa]UZO95027.1 Channel protein VirB6 [Roseomonas mucosa]